jgi:hypothetical protein
MSEAVAVIVGAYVAVELALGGAGLLAWAVGLLRPRR